jgi:tape measure domain-containing protein
VAKSIAMYKLGVVLDVNGAKGLSTLKQTDAELTKVDKSGKRAEGTLGKVAGALGRVSSALKGNAGGAGSGGWLPGLAHVSNIIQGLPQIGQLAGALVSPLTEAAQSGVRFNAFLETTEIALKRHFGGSRDMARGFVNEVRSFAQSSPFRTEGLIRTIIYGTATGFSPREALALVKDVGDAIASTGDISEETVEGVVRALSQMKAKGTVSAEEMEQLAERGIPAWEMLAHSIGKSVAETRKLSEQGKLHGPSAVAALRAEMRARYGGMMDELQSTLTGRMSALEDALQAGQAKATESLTRDISETVAAGLQRAGLVDSLASTINGAIAPVSGLVRSAAVSVLGGGLTSGLAEGINAGKSLVTQTVGQFALDSVISPFKRMLGINSPSTVFAEYGDDVAQGFEDGLVDRTSRGFDRWAKALEKAGGDAFIRGVEGIARRLGIDPAWLMNVIAFESGFNAKARNPTSSARGLIQFMDRTARGLGLKDSDQFLGMSAMQQLPFVERYFRPYAGKMHTQGDVYAAVAGPAALSRRDRVLYRAGSREYNANRVWDANRDGVITAPEIGGLAARRGQFTSGGFLVNNSPVSAANPVPVYGVGGSAPAGLGLDPGGAFNPATAAQVLASARRFGRALQDAGTTVVDVNDNLGEIVTTATQVVGAEGLHFYKTQQLTQATERQTLAAGHAAQTVLGLAKSAESTGQKLVGMLAGLGGLMPQQQVGKKRGFFSKLLGVAAPFLSFIPGVGPILSTLAGIGSSALAGDWGGALTGAVGGFAPGGAFRRSGGGTPARTPQASLNPNDYGMGSDLSGARAQGGPVRRGRSYLVGEYRTEVFTPDEDGYVHPSTGHYLARRGGGGASGGWEAMVERLLRAIEENSATLSTFKSVPPDHVVMKGARTAAGAAAVGDAFMRHGSRDPAVVEWMSRRVNNL